MQDVPSNDLENKDRDNCWERPILWTIVEHKGIQHLTQVLQDATDKSEGSFHKFIFISGFIEY